MATSSCRCPVAASSGVAGPSPRCPPPVAIGRRFPRQQPKSAVLTQASCINPRALNSVNAAAALPVVRKATPQPQAFGSSRRRSLDDSGRIDILGLGQAIVDLSSSVSDETLDSFDLAKGSRRVVTVEERAQVMETLDDLGCPSQISAGGSLANTLVGVARLARAAGSELRVTLGGSLGGDTLGQYFNSQMRQAGVQCLVDHPTSSSSAASSSSFSSSSSSSSSSETGEAEGAATGHTGTVMVLTTPDAQRSFLSFFTSEVLSVSERLRAAVRSSRLVVVEGYMWEMAGAEQYILEVLRTAHAAGGQVALTAGDPGVVSRHRDAILRVLSHGVDMVFMNEEEAAALAGLQGQGQGAGEVDGQAAAAALAQLCPMCVVTAGSKGSYVCAVGEVHQVPPFWLPQGPVDTCGAGDAYAAGWLYAMLSGYDLRTAGEFASRVASAVIGRYGPHLGDEDAEELVSELPEHVGPLRVGALGSRGAEGSGEGGLRMGPQL